MRILMAIVCATLMCSCATRQKTYTPPSDAKVVASEKALNEKVTKARATAAKAQQAALEAKEIAAKLDASAKIWGPMVEKLIKDVPEEFKQPARDIQNALKEHLVQETFLKQKIDEAVGHNAQLKIDLAEAETARSILKQAQLEYRAEAQKLADAATEERDKRIAVEKKLSWYRWHWWGSWIVLGLGVLACGILAFLKFTGRLAIGASKLML
jgi:hypothetical protein